MNMYARHQHTGKAIPVKQFYPRGKRKTNLASTLTD